MRAASRSILAACLALAVSAAGAAAQPWSELSLADDNAGRAAARVDSAPSGR